MVKSLNAVIIGCGQIAGGYDLKTPKELVMTHAKALNNNPEAKLVGVYDIDQAKAQEFCRQWNVPKAFSHIDTLLKECTPDIVIICTPNETHFEIFQNVLKFKPKAIVCEKPLALHHSQAQTMANQCSEAGILLVVNYLRRWDDSLTKLGERILEGEFGEFQMARVLYTKGVFHNASHAINLFQKWMGNFKALSVERVLEIKGEDLLADFTLSFDRCTKVTFEALDASFYNYFEIDLHFSKARVFLPGGGRETQTFKVKENFLIRESQEEGTLLRAVQNVIDNTIDCVSGRATLAMDPEEASYTIQICEEIRRTAK